MRFFRNINWWVVGVTVAILLLVLWVKPLGSDGAAWNEASRQAADAYEAGKFAEAESHANAAMRSLNASDLSDVRVGDTAMLLGMIYEKTDRAEKSAEAYRRAVDVYRTSLGPASPRVGDALLALATVHATQSQWREAEAAASAALKNFHLSSPRPDKVAAAESLLTTAEAARRNPTTQP